MKKLSDESIVKILGITLEEYKALSHKPLKTFLDLQGNIREYYIQVSTNNDPEVLKKLSMDKRNLVRFKPEDVRKLNLLKERH